MSKDVDLLVTAVEESMVAMTRALRELQRLCPGMDANALSYSLDIGIRMEKAADDLKDATKLLRETAIKGMLTRHSTNR